MRLELMLFVRERRGGVHCRLYPLDGLGHSGQTNSIDDAAAVEIRDYPQSIDG